MNKLHTVFLTVLLTACGGGGGDSTQTTPTPAPTPAPGPTTVPPITPAPATKFDLENSWTGDFVFNFNNTANLAVNNTFDTPPAEVFFNTNNENQNNTNLTAYTSTGDEDIDAIIAAEQTFIADVSYSSEIDSYFLTSDPDIQSALGGESASWGNPDSEGCSVIKVIAPSYQYECFFPYFVGRAEPKLKRLATALDFSRETIEFNPDGYSIFNAYLANYDRDFPPGVSGGSNDSVTMFHNGTDAFLATPDGYRNEGAGWMNNIIFVTFDGPWFLENGGFYQDLPYRYHFWDVSGGGEPVLTHALDCTGDASDCGNDLAGIMVQGDGKIYTQGRIFSQSNSGTIQVKDSAINTPIKGPDNKIWAVVGEEGGLDRELEIQEVVNDSINVDGAVRSVINEGLPTETTIRRGSGVAPIQYPVITLTDQYLMHVRALPPKDPTSSIEGASYPLTDSINLGGGYELADSGKRADLLVLTVPSVLPNTDDLVINYQVNNGSSSRSFTITHETISNFLNSEYYDGGTWPGGARTLAWPTPEPHREGICIIDFINNNEKCESFDDYMVISTDLESLYFNQRFDGNEDYPNPDHQYNFLGRNPPGIHSIKLIENELLIYFKNSTQDKAGGTLYKASGDIDNFMQDGLTTFTVTESTNVESDFELIMSLIKIQ